LLGHGLTPIPTQTSTHSLPALVFASQSPYTGWQPVINSQTLGEMPQFSKKFLRKSLIF
jgi:hypothetical protein